MSVYSELVNETGVNPSELYKIIDGYTGSAFPEWNLPPIDILDIWGDMSLRAAVALLTGGDTPTTYSRRMADMIRILTDPVPTLLGLDEDPVEAEFTRALEVVRDLRRDTLDGEVIDD